MNGIVLLLEPNTQGPGAHAHEKEDCIFYVIERTMSIPLSEVHRQIGNAVPSALGELLALEMRRQLLDERVPLRASTLLPPRRLSVPKPEPIRPVVKKYRELAGAHDPHPGTGMGYGALRRAA